MLRIILVTLFSLFSLDVHSEYTHSVITFENKSLVGEHCAKIFIERIIKNQEEDRNTVLGLATGSTPIPFYQALIKQVKEQQIDLSRVITFNLDEYLGLPKDHPQSYYHFMYTHLFNELLYPEYPFGIKQENIHIPNGLARTLKNLTEDEKSYLAFTFPQRSEDNFLTQQEELSILKYRAEAYESEIDHLGPIDLQILGIGTNGHIGFAEPGSSFDGTTMIIKLSLNTRQDNMRFFENKLDNVPEYAMTMGIGTILKAKEIILIATGTTKSHIINKTLSHPITEKIPATALREHAQTLFLLDIEAAQEIGHVF